MIAAPPTTCAVIQRTMDARHVNAVVNHPDVRPWLGGDGSLDLTPLADDPAHFLFNTAHGAMVCQALGSGVYDVHSMFLPEGRGAEALQAMGDVADFMFTGTDCVEGRTTVPIRNRAAAVAAKRAGFTPIFTSWLPWSGGTRVEADFLTLSIDRWALTAPRAARRGVWFHDQLASAKLASGSALEVHEDDPVHDRMVGATALMAQAGNGEKAVRFYNVWAGSAGYTAVSLLRARPIVIDLVDAIIEVHAGGMEVLRCR